MAIVVLVVSNGGASAQTLGLGTTRVAEQSTLVEKSSTVSRVKVWTRARWEAARKDWARNNAKSILAATSGESKQVAANILSMISESFSFNA